MLHIYQIILGIFGAQFVKKCIYAYGQLQTFNDGNFESLQSVLKLNFMSNICIFAITVLFVLLTVFVVMFYIEVHKKLNHIEKIANNVNNKKEVNVL